MIRILQVMGAFDCGGAENMIMNIYRNIDRNIVQFDFVIHNDKKCFFEDEVKKMGGNIYRVPRYKLYNHFSYKHAWETFFTNHPEYKIVHCHIRSVASIIMKIAKKHNIITISHSHNTSNGNGFSSLVKKHLQNKIVKYGDYFFGCSSDSAKWLFGEKANTEQCIIINNAIDVDKYAFDINKRKQMRKKLNINDNEIAIVQVGRLATVKNHIFTLKLIKELDNKKVNNKYFILGEGDQQSYLEEYINSNGLKNVSFMGVRNDVFDILQAMDIFIMPSLYEGLPLALVEAQASSLPCIVSTNISAGIFNKDIVFPISLESDINAWVDKIVYASKIERKDASKLIKENGFDIKENAIFLQNFYLKAQKYKNSKVALK